MTAPTQAPPSTGGEYVCVQRAPDAETRLAMSVALDAWVQAGAPKRQAPRYPASAMWPVYKAALAAPTGYVPVKRELLVRLCSARADWHLALAELRALLSPAPKDEAK